MPIEHSRIGKPVERIRINDEPHERYKQIHPWTGEAIYPGIPILMKAETGNIIRKDVTHSRVKCPECDIGAEYDDDSEPVCPSCGIICAGNGEVTEEIVFDAKAAERY